MGLFLQCKKGRSDRPSLVLALPPGVSARKDAADIREDGLGRNPGRNPGRFGRQGSAAAGMSAQDEGLATLFQIPLDHRIEAPAGAPLQGPGQLAGDLGLFRLGRLRQLALELGQLFLAGTTLTKITLTLRGAHAMIP